MWGESKVFFKTLECMIYHCESTMARAGPGRVPGRHEKCISFKIYFKALHSTHGHVASALCEIVC